jgi:hypothetical protein
MLSRHALQTVQVWLRSVTNYGHFSCRALRLFGGISDFIGGDFPEYSNLILYTQALQKV